MTRFVYSITLFLCISSFGVQAKNVKRFKSSLGKEIDFHIDAFDKNCKLFLPKNYKPKKKHPVILHMHGAGGQPNTFIHQYATQKRDYIIVGLAYLERGTNAGEEIKEMREYFKAVLGELKKEYSINEKKVVLSGLSMGGWALGYFAFNKETRSLFKGYCIVAAGPTQQVRLRIRGSKMKSAIPGIENLKGFPILVLNGAKDVNLASANEGCPVLKKNGVKVTQVVIPGEGHVPNPNKMRPHIKKWLDKLWVKRKK